MERDTAELGDMQGRTHVHLACVHVAVFGSDVCRGRKLHEQSRQYILLESAISSQIFTEVRAAMNIQQDSFVSFSVFS